MPQALNTAIENIRKGRKADSASAENQYQALEKYTRDLTAAAREGKLDPVIGRDEEIRRVVQVLSRRTKNNPVLIGAGLDVESGLHEFISDDHELVALARERDVELRDLRKPPAA